MLKSKLNLVVLAALVLSGGGLSFGQNASQSEAELLAILQKPDATRKEKSDACLFLARVATKNAVPVLAALLPNEEMNHMARYALETIPDSSVDEALRAALAKTQGRPLVGVIGSIGVRKDAQAVEPLTPFLQNANADVAQAAARALGSIGNTAAARAIQTALAQTSAANQLAFCEGLFRCAEAMSAKGQQAEAIAIYDRLRGLQGAPHQVRAGALRGAILARGDRGTPLLQQTLTGDDYILFAAAVRTAQEMKGSTVTKALTSDLAKLPADRQIVVIETLGLRADPAALPALFAAAKGGEKKIRIAAIRAVPMIGAASAAPTFVGMLQDTDREVAQAARESLAALPGKEVDAAVMAMLSKGDADQQLAAIDLIGRRRMTTAVPELVKASSTASAQVRPAATKRLGELAGPAELPTLLDLLMQTKDSAVLDAAEQAVSAVCSRFEDPEGNAGKIAVLIAQAQSAQKAALLRILSGIGGPAALKAVRATVSDPNADVRKAAIRALGGWKTADAAPDLLELAQNAKDPTEKMLCLRSYLGLADNPDLQARRRLAMCRDAASLVQTTDEKKLLLSALGSVASTDSITLILPYLEDPATKAEAGAAVVGISDKLLKGRGAAASAPRLIQPLEKVIQANEGTGVAKRASAALEQARQRSRAK